jgi:hypothetical protein
MQITKFKPLRVPKFITNDKLKFNIICILILSLILGSIVSACQSSQEDNATKIKVTIIVDGNTRELEIPIGTTVQSTLESAGITLQSLDRSEPPFSTSLVENTTIKVIRVIEKFEIEQAVIPFEHQIIHNESLPEGETRLIQPGVNGSQENTYRLLYEDGVQISNNIIKTVVLQEAIPEILMIGVQAPFAPVNIKGKLAYLTGGNAWIIENTTANRFPLITSGDLDGRVFSLSPDGKWLLFTRKPETDDEENIINTLWVVETVAKSKPINLRVNNIVNFGDWVPGQQATYSYSTVEPRETAPGWQANNDLYTNRINSEGQIPVAKNILDVNSGGVYGWWGTTYSWSPDGSQAAFARPGSIGLVDADDSEITSLADITPLNTQSEWAWVPGIKWGPDGNVIYTVFHAPDYTEADPENSTKFDLVAIPLTGGPFIPLVKQAGMFAYPVPSPFDANNNYAIAYLQAIFPDQSDSSRYRLMIMDRDGSNRQDLFPKEGLPGLDPQTVSWSPAASGDEDLQIAVLYQGNIWIINSKTGQEQQITGDGLTKRLDWK